MGLVDWVRGLFTAEPPPQGYVFGSVVLLIESPTLEQRVPSVDALSSYIQALQGVCTTRLEDVSWVGGLDLTVAVWEGRRSEVWYRCTEPISMAPLLEALRAVPGPELRGPIAFVLRGSVGCLPDGDTLPLLPQPWLDVVEAEHNEAMSVHEILDRLRPG